MADTHKVIALLSKRDGKHVGCQIIPKDNFYPAIYKLVFGPDTETACDNFVANECGGFDLRETLHHQPVNCADLVGRPARYYKKGDPLTEDFLPNRVNIEHNGQHVITDIWFG